LNTTGLPSLRRIKGGRIAPPPTWWAIPSPPPVPGCVPTPLRPHLPAATWPLLLPQKPWGAEASTAMGWGGERVGGGDPPCKPQPRKEPPSPSPSPLRPPTPRAVVRIIPCTPDGPERFPTPFLTISPPRPGPHRPIAPSRHQRWGPIVVLTARRLPRSLGPGSTSPPPRPLPGGGLNRDPIPDTHRGGGGGGGDVPGMS